MDRTDERRRSRSRSRSRDRKHKHSKHDKHGRDDKERKHRKDRSRSRDRTDGKSSHHHKHGHRHRSRSSSKDRKPSSSSHHRSAAASSSSGFVPKPVNPLGRSPDVKIADDDFAERAVEFRYWLQTQKGLKLFDMDKKTARAIFSTDFVPAYNAGQLDKRVYAGDLRALTDALEGTARTEHVWGFAKHLTENDRMTLDTVKDTVSSATLAPAKPPLR